MKFFALAIAVSLALATIVAGEEFAAPVAEREEAVAAPDPAIDKRECVPSKCRCNKVSGLFCGNSKIDVNCPSSHVFQCNPSGATCDFGVRDSCAKCGKLGCP